MLSATIGQLVGNTFGITIFCNPLRGSGVISEFGSISEVILIGSVSAIITRNG